MRERFVELTAPLHEPETRSLFGAQLVSGLGDWAGRLALTVVVYDKSGSAWWAAAVTIASLLPWLGPGQLLSTFADRFGRIQVMIAADLARAALFLTMLAPVPTTVLLVLALLAGLCVPPFVSARGSAIVDIVSPHRYGASLALFGVTSQAELVLGYALGGLMIAALGAQATLAVNASTFLMSALLIIGLRRSKASEPHEGSSLGFAGVRAGAAVWRSDPLCRRALFLFVGVNMLMVLPEALVVPYADEIGAPSRSVGLLAATIAAGSLIAIAASPDHDDPQTLLRRAAARTLLFAACAAVLFALSNSWALAAVPALLLSGAVDAISVPTNQVVGARLPRENRAAAMSVAGGVQYGSQTAAIAVGGALAVAFGSGWVLFAGAAGACAVTGWSLLRPP